MVKKDLSDLPYQPSKAEQIATAPLSVYPSTDPIIGPAMAQAWFEQHDGKDYLPPAIPEAGPFRGSHAGSCSRQVAYNILQIKQSNPPTPADFWRMGLGQIIHTYMQDAIATATPGSSAEVEIDLNAIGIRGSLRADLHVPLYPDEDENHEYIMAELKTINGFQFKLRSTNFRKTGPSGPSESHVIQLALETAGAAAAFDGDNRGGRLVYLSMEVVSPELTENMGIGDDSARFVAEYEFTLDQLQGLAVLEAARFQEIDEAMRHDNWVEPVVVQSAFPYTTAVVVNPRTGAAIDERGKGTKTWQCAYCNYRDTCTADMADHNRAAPDVG